MPWRGAPLTSDPAPDNSERRAEARLTYLADYDEASHDVHDLVEPFFTVFAYGQLAHLPARAARLQGPAGLRAAPG